MNIGILIPELGGGGAERASQILGNYFIEGGNRVFYFLLDTNVKQEYLVRGEIIQTNIKSCMSKDISDIQRLFWLFKSSLQMRRLKHQYDIDVAISFMEEFNYINVLSKGREAVITRVCTILSQRKDLDGFLYKKAIVHIFYSMADKVIVMSNYALKDMCDYYGLSRKKLIKIPNAVAGLDMGKEDRWEYGNKALVCVGRLESVKQHDRIIRAFSYVTDKEKQAKLIVLGKGPNLNYLKRLCARYGLEDKVIFAGFTERITFYLKQARAFVMASKVEGFPNSMIEAMHCGAPVITTDSPGACGEIVGKPVKMGEVNSMVLCRYGILVPAMPDTKLNPALPLVEEEELLGKAMMKVLSEDRIYEEYCKRSRKRAKMYLISRVGERWNSLLDDR